MTDLEQPGPEPCERTATTMNGHDPETSAADTPVVKGIPFVITARMRTTLLAAGFTAAEISEMTPADAAALVGDPAKRREPQPPSDPEARDQETEHRADDPPPKMLDVDDISRMHGAEAVRELNDGARPEPGHGAGEAPRAKPPKRSWRDSTILARDLCDKKFPTLKYIVPGIFPEGVILLVSRPKLGKSWLLQQVGSSVALGNSVLVNVDEPTHGDVLYLNLEDGERRAQRRMTKYFGAQRDNWPERMRNASTWRRLDQGGLADLREWCGSVKKPTLIMIDTLKRVRAPKRNGQSDYDADYEACQGLLDLSHDFPGLLIIVAHHDRKMDAEDVFDTASGTLGMTGGVDTIVMLKRNAHGVTLHVRGRDLDDDVEKAVKFDRETCRWVILGEASEVHRSEGRTRVLDVLAASAEELSVREIMAEADLGTQDAAWQLLHRMVKAGEIERRGRGKYRLPVAPLSVSKTPLSGVSGTSGTVFSSVLSEDLSPSGLPDTPDRGVQGEPNRQEPDRHSRGANPSLGEAAAPAGRSRRVVS
jgi:hypothetical protein